MSEEPAKAWKPTPKPLAALLPPRFPRPELQPAAQRGSNRSGEVVLPTADGGTVIVKQNIQVIEHQGQSVELRSLPPQVRQRRRQITNTIVMAVGLLILILAFWWLVSDL